MTVPRRYGVDDCVPEPLIMLYDFLNSLDERTDGTHQPVDTMASPVDLRDFLVDVGLLPASASATAADLEVARELRAGLRAATRNNAPALHGHAAPGEGAAGPHDAGELTGLFARFNLRVVVGADGALALDATEPGVRGALGRILAQAAAAAARGEWRRLKTCSADDCRWVFYDASKPRTARWCDSATCGNRHKTRAYRQRLKGRAGVPIEGRPEPPPPGIQ
ncbi:MAG TPA: CGNR zinc finger domain-containing protein [Candidatus Dormibacteraeota bacterium]|jgi:predicted RNA-binding Zn ribbon-like protein|nr:CGNR zinc finger domain-containing protein [Candidatus Dormibacteraeota bacterium]